MTSFKEQEGPQLEEVGVNQAVDLDPEDQSSRPVSVYLLKP